MESNINQFTLGLIINPIAGMGGSVGLKGSDGEEIILHAKELGAEIQAPRRTLEFLDSLFNFNKQIKIVTIPGIMGENSVKQTKFRYELIQDPLFNSSTLIYNTDSRHTIVAAKILAEYPVDLIIFVGGDGTARDIYNAVKESIPCLGIPAGVKIHSSVFATSPLTASELVKKYIDGQAFLKESEVLDIDEDQFRDNRVESKLYGYINTPYLPTLIQASKLASPHTLEDNENQIRIANYLIREMEKDDNWHYLLGPGTTTRAIATELDLPKTLLGVDLIFKKKVIQYDLNENQILDRCKDKQVKLIVTPIGAQGFIFGRGNLQLSPKVLFEIGLQNIIIIATKFKMTTLPDGKMRIDSRDLQFDKRFRGLHRVLVDFAEFQIVDVK